MKASAKSRVESPNRRQHPAYLPYMYLVITLGFSAILYSITRLMLPEAGYQWLILASLTLLTSCCSIKIPGTNSKISIGDTLLFTNLLLFGTAAGVITAALDGLVGSLRARRKSLRLQYALFNVAALATSAFLGGTVFFSLLGSGPLSQGPTPAVPNLLIPIGVLAFTHYLLNSGSVAIIVALEKRKNIYRIWKDSFLWTSITYFAGAAAAGFIAVVVGSITPQVLGVAVPVLLAVYFTYKTYLQKVHEVRSLAFYDGLTRLPNRILFKEHLTQMIATSERQSRMMALIFLDIDHFKWVNDTYGHNVGDMLLKGVSERLTSCLRLSDSVSRHGENELPVSLGRFGGDEFTIAVTEIDKPQDAAKVSQRILEALSAPFMLEGEEINVRASLGISIFPLDGRDPDVLLKNADAAMFHAKDSGRNNYQFYSQSMNDRLMKRLSLENDFRKALERDEFRIHYQPKLDARTRRVIGSEALIRWQHPGKGLLYPAEFIPLAEETGLIVPMGDWVLRTVCEQIVSWRRSGLDPLPVAVNLSSVQIREKSLKQTVAMILGETGLDPGLLELEITESAIMENEEKSDWVLRELSSLGIKLSIDDFGTGYSSLARLKRFKLDSLKIDKSFVMDLERDPDDRAITKAIIAMARSLDLKVIAEGVETKEQLEFLSEQRCDELQGFLFSRPLPADKYALLITEESRPQRSLLGAREHDPDEIRLADACTLRYTH